MSHMTRQSPDTSVTFSLSELAKLEEQRVREDDARRARANEERARERRLAEARLRAEEEARIAGEATVRAERERAIAEDNARIEARRQAAIDVARIEAEAKARLEADNAVRAYELAVLRERKDRGKSRLSSALAAVLGLVICGGSASAYGVTRHVDGLEREAERLRERQVALAREREQAASSELAALDRRHDSFRSSPVAQRAVQALEAADSARNAIGSHAADQARLRDYRDALDALSVRIDSLEKIAELDQRRSDLITLAGDRRVGDVVKRVDEAAARARTGQADEAALASYRRALDELRDRLAAPVGGGGGRRVEPEIQTGRTCSDPNDPLCGLNGKPL